ncbi:hypothetical protein FPZ43_05675 [Mucilaginibacter pallidiroseus]|uniref:DUF4440 domain-containing protein n=1 Tax=Mucilaginibacter pallidiroseus TaxID=2599295 RepID=A0A563UGB5_9SPHI|nr:hypothetical protein [Mucilaginibacter pallidiroseus]TWR30430.1 hypothetical protein FPZ43_05675 [Mucilaginibacter pallidiroseus]
MKKLIFSAIIASALTSAAFAQNKQVTVDQVVKAEQNFDNIVQKKGMKAGFLAVADYEGIVFKPQPVKITEFYGSIDKQPGKLIAEPKFARISANGDLGFTAGPYVYQNGKTDDDKVFGQYVSIWRLDTENKWKLLINVGMPHPEPEGEMQTDFKEPDLSKQKAASKDPFAGKNIIVGTDNLLNKALATYPALAAYKEFLSPEAHFYFPGFEPIVGPDKIMKFLDNEGVSISAETINAGRSSSADLAYSYGKARIKKGNIVNNYNYVRIWEIGADHKWNLLVEIFSTVE